MGYISANAVAYVNSLLGDEVAGTVKREHLWQCQVYDMMRCSVSAENVELWARDLQARRQQAWKEHTDMAKVKRIKEKAHLIEVADARRNAIKCGDVGHYSSMVVPRLLGPLKQATGDVDADGILLVLDIETPGFSPYSDELMELSMSAVRYTTSDEGVTTFGELSVRFEGIARTMVVNTQLGIFAGQPALREQVYREAQTEKSLVQSWVKWMRDTLSAPSAKTTEGEPLSAYIVAHNGIVFDAPFVHRALHRAGITSTDLFEELHIVGLIDTVELSKRDVNWAAWITPPPPAEAGVRVAEERRRAVPLARALADTAEHLHVEWNTEKQGAGKKRRTEAAAPRDMDDWDEGDYDSMHCDGGGGEDDRKFSHAQGVIFERLFGVQAEGAHQASHDVVALQKIVTHHLFWKEIHKCTVSVPWEWMAEHADELHKKQLQRTRGWAQQDCPRCLHGPTRVSATKDESYVQGWRVNFTCILNCTGPECTFGAEETRDGFVEELPKKGKGSRVAQKGDAGACTCGAGCVRACPCRSASVHCTPACGGKRKHNKCKNMPVSEAASSPLSAAV